MRLWQRKSALGDNLLVVAKTMYRICNEVGCGLLRPGKAPLTAEALESAINHISSSPQLIRRVFRARAILCLRTVYVRSM